VSRGSSKSSRVESRIEFRQVAVCLEQDLIGLQAGRAYRVSELSRLTANASKLEDPERVGLKAGRVPRKTLAGFKDCINLKIKFCSS
jgi:hypothetical protein